MIYDWIEAVVYVCKHQLPRLHDLPLRQRLEGGGVGVPPAVLFVFFVAGGLQHCHVHVGAQPPQRLAPRSRVAGEQHVDSGT